MENTHPFMSCSKEFAFAHNGHAFVTYLRTYLLEAGHRIHGETDSEVLMHLLEQYLEECGDMVEAIKELVENNLSGTIVILVRDGEIYAARSGFNPLHYAVKDGEVYIASSREAVKSLIGGGVRVFEVVDGGIVKVENGRVSRYRAKSRKFFNCLNPYYGSYRWFDVDMFLH